MAMPTWKGNIKMFFLLEPKICLFMFGLHTVEKWAISVQKHMVVPLFKTHMLTVLFKVINWVWKYLFIFQSFLVITVTDVTLFWPMKLGN